MIDIKCKCKVWGCAGSDEESEFEKDKFKDSNVQFHLAILKFKGLADCI